VLGVGGGIHGGCGSGVAAAAVYAGWAVSSRISRWARGLCPLSDRKRCRTPILENAVHGQSVFFAGFLASTGVFGRWVWRCPPEYRSGNALDKPDVLRTLIRWWHTTRDCTAGARSAAW
jgi:hypothetical protein